MFKNISKFQLALIGAFVLFAIAGVAIFASNRSSSNNAPTKVTIWGTFDQSLMSSFIQRVVSLSKNTLSIVYVQKTPEGFENSLLEAIATGQGPDAILVTQNTVLSEANKIYQIPYSEISARDFTSTFIPESELFLSAGGEMALPFAIDPMVMYWNRDIFSNANISEPPQYWTQFLKLAPTLTKINDAQEIIQSATGLGEYHNINYAKDILSLLIMQAGDPIVTTELGKYRSVLNSSTNQSSSPANSALSFYTQFADPQKPTYSWNRALPDSETLFLSNKLGIYFGYASDYEILKGKNPNLNFDVAVVPQAAPSTTAQYVSKTFGNVYGLSILRSSKNVPATYKTIVALVQKPSLDLWSAVSGLPSVRRDSLNNPADAVGAVFAQSALWSAGWLDPDYSESEAIFQNMIEDVTSGRKLYFASVADADARLNRLIETVNNKLTTTK